MAPSRGCVGEGQGAQGAGVGDVHEAGRAAATTLPAQQPVLWIATLVWLCVQSEPASELAVNLHGHACGAVGQETLLRRSGCLSATVCRGKQSQLAHNSHDLT